MLYMIKIRNNKDFLTLKNKWFFEYQNFFYFRSNFIFSWLACILVANPVTSSMLKFYEKTKSQYARDIEHLLLLIKMVYG